MADKVMRWYIDGLISKEKTQVGGVYRLDDDYEPVEVYMNCRVAGAINTGTEIDICADGISIFDYKPVLNPNDTEKIWSTIPSDMLREGSIIRLDITGIPDETPCRDLTVELVLNK